MNFRLTCCAKWCELWRCEKGRAAWRRPGGKPGSSHDWSDNPQTLQLGDEVQLECIGFAVFYRRACCI
jgi:hypothetical protein